jgi:hypothetical protein
MAGGPIYKGGRPFTKPGLRINGSPSTAIISGAGAPTSGTSGTGLNYAGPGSLYIDYTNGLQYINSGTAASPLWVISAGVGGARVEVLTTTRVLTLADSGKVFALNLAGGFTVTLPALSGSTGFNARFIVQTAPSGGSYSITSAEGDNIAGSVFPGDGTAGDSEAAFTADAINLVDGQAVIGDQADIVALAAGWAGRAFVKVAAGATFTG